MMFTMIYYLISASMLQITNADEFTKPQQVKVVLYSPEERLEFLCQTETVQTVGHRFVEQLRKQGTLQQTIAFDYYPPADTMYCFMKGVELFYKLDHISPFTAEERVAFEEIVESMGMKQK